MPHGRHGSKEKVALLLSGLYHSTRQTLAARWGKTMNASCVCVCEKTRKKKNERAESRMRSSHPGHYHCRHAASGTGRQVQYTWCLSGWEGEEPGMFFLGRRCLEACLSEEEEFPTPQAGCWYSVQGSFSPSVTHQQIVGIQEWGGL